MSIEAMTQVWSYSAQTGGNLLVMLALADYADDRGRAWPAHETLATKSRKHVRSVQRILNKLEAAGEIERVGTTKSGTIVWELSDFRGRQNVALAKRHPDKNDPNPAQNVSQGVVKMPPNPSVNPLTNPHEGIDGESTDSTSSSWPVWVPADLHPEILALMGYTPSTVKQSEVLNLGKALDRLRGDEMLDELRRRIVGWRRNRSSGGTNRPDASPICKADVVFEFAARIASEAVPA